MNDPSYADGNDLIEITSVDAVNLQNERSSTLFTHESFTHLFCLSDLMVDHSGSCHVDIFRQKFFSKLQQ